MLRASSVLNARVTIASKPDVTAATAWTTGNSPITIFTVTGTVLITCAGVVTTPLTSTGATGTLAIGVAGTTGGLIAATTVDGTKLHTAKFVWADTSASAAIVALPGTSGWFIVSGTNIILTVATNSMTAGGMDIYALWFPLSSGANVV
ncbi:MAG TPA: hypothetical protein VF516_03225 [Kofleriaceae bacterium]